MCVCEEGEGWVSTHLYVQTEEEMSFWGQKRGVSLSVRNLPGKQHVAWSFVSGGAGEMSVNRSETERGPERSCRIHTAQGS